MKKQPTVGKLDFQGFEVWPNPIFCVGNILSIIIQCFELFLGFRKVSTIFLDLTNFQLFFWVFQFLHECFTFRFCTDH